MCTFYEKGLLVVDVHETVGTGVTVASKWVPDQLLPWWLCDRDIIVLHPATLMWVVDISPVVACIGLAFMDQHCMKPVWHLEKHKGDLKALDMTFGIAIKISYRKVLLTCIIDLSEYISSMVLWILVILPCRSGEKNIIYNLLLSADLFTFAILYKGWTSKSYWRNHNRDTHKAQHLGGRHTHHECHFPLHFSNDASSPRAPSALLQWCAVGQGAWGGQEEAGTG